MKYSITNLKTFLFVFLMVFGTVVQVKCAKQKSKKRVLVKTNSQEKIVDTKDQWIGRPLTISALVAGLTAWTALFFYLGKTYQAPTDFPCEHARPEQPSRTPDTFNIECKVKNCPDQSNKFLIERKHITQGNERQHVIICVKKADGEALFTSNSVEMNDDQAKRLLWSIKDFFALPGLFCQLLNAAERTLPAQPDE